MDAAAVRPAVMSRISGMGHQSHATLRHWTERAQITPGHGTRPSNGPGNGPSSSFAVSHQSTLSQRSRQTAVLRALGSDDNYPAPKRSKDPEKRPLPETLEVDQEELEEFLALDLQSAFDAPPRHYEFVFLIGENNVEEIPAFLEKLKDQVAQMRGKITRLNDWGLRPLAYKIKKQKQANYFLLNVEVSPEKANDLNTFFQKEERVIRHLMTKAEKAETQDYPAPIMYNAPMSEDDEFDDDDEDEDDEEDEEDEEEDEEEEDAEEDGEEGVLAESRAEASKPIAAR